MDKTLFKSKYACIKMRIKSQFIVWSNIWIIKLKTEWTAKDNLLMGVSLSACISMSQPFLSFWFFFISPSEELVGRRTRKPYLLKHHYNHSKKRGLRQAVRRVIILHGIVDSLFFFWSTSLCVRIALDMHCLRYALIPAKMNGKKKYASRSECSKSSCKIKIGLG